MAELESPVNHRKIREQSGSGVINAPSPFAGFEVGQNSQGRHSIVMQHKNGATEHQACSHIGVRAVSSFTGRMGEKVHKEWNTGHEASLVTAGVQGHHSQGGLATGFLGSQWSTDFGNSQERKDTAYRRLNQELKRQPKKCAVTTQKSLVKRMDKIKSRMSQLEEENKELQQVATHLSLRLEHTVDEQKRKKQQMVSRGTQVNMALEEGQTVTQGTQVNMRVILKPVILGCKGDATPRALAVRGESGGKRLLLLPSDRDNSTSASHAAQKKTEDRVKKRGIENSHDRPLLCSGNTQGTAEDAKSYEPMITKEMRPMKGGTRFSSPTDLVQNEATAGSTSLIISNTAVPFFSKIQFQKVKPTRLSHEKRQSLHGAVESRTITSPSCQSSQESSSLNHDDSVSSVPYSFPSPKESHTVKVAPQQVTISKRSSLKLFNHISQDGPIPTTPSRFSSLPDLLLPQHDTPLPTNTFPKKDAPLPTASSSYPLVLDPPFSQRDYPSPTTSSTYPSLQESLTVKQNACSKNSLSSHPSLQRQAYARQDAPLPTTSSTFQPSTELCFPRCDTPLPATQTATDTSSRKSFDRPYRPETHKLPKISNVTSYHGKQFPVDIFASKCATHPCGSRSFNTVSSTEKRVFYPPSTKSISVRSTAPDIQFSRKFTLESPPEQCPTRQQSHLMSLLSCEQSIAEEYMTTPFDGQHVCQDWLQQDHSKAFNSVNGREIPQSRSEDVIPQNQMQSYDRSVSFEPNYQIKQTINNFCLPGRNSNKTTEEGTSYHQDRCPYKQHENRQQRKHTRRRPKHPSPCKQS